MIYFKYVIDAYKNVISLSGGKDSTALLLEAVRRGVEFEAVFADTGHENPITYEYIGYLSMMLDIRIRWVKADFSEQIARKRNYVATRWLLWCGATPPKVGKFLKRN